ncbi:MAG: NADH-quinone oxidoreductase subunit NuoE [Planctomycetota bacterium]|nr:NADH-quinone oxidoreductase subunit NuoE [Planctomycetota bacterium]
MAWIVKPSATQEIEKRKKPYVTDKMAKRFETQIIPRYEKKQGALMLILHEIQHEYGYIPHQAMIEVATLLDLHPGDVLDMCSFYEEFHTQPVGKYVIGVCQSIACEVCGHQAILDHIKNKLDIEPHETTDDGKFTLLAMECLGACEGAPCALVNDDRHDNLTIKQIDELIDNLPD